MSVSSYFLIIIALAISLAIAYFQYFYQIKGKSKITYLLFALRSSSIFLLLLLLINPTITYSEVQTIKPSLSVAVDNSESVAYFKDGDNVKQTISTFKNNTVLNNKFDISYFSFGSSFQVLDSLTFSEPQTNINQAINNVRTLYNEGITPIVLISDGNQTLGNDYEFSNISQPIYPYVIGDTARYKDLKISQLNVNKYSYLKNNFPVEAMLSYEGTGPVSTRFTIRQKGKRVFSKNVIFSNTKRTATLTTTLPSLQAGKNYYTASIQQIPNEKNTVNNTKTFSVEVIDQQTKILLVGEMIHPDMGAIARAIETNKQRKAAIKIIGKDTFNLNEYQLIILYQPTSNFATLFTEIAKNKLHYFVVTGTKTDWSFMNRLQLGFSKNAINRTENFTANFNKNFLTYNQEDIGFYQFPPLEDKFGENLFSKAYEPLLFQNINGIAFDFPLLATLEESGQKSAVLFGEGIWKWRAASYRNLSSFEDFDSFLSNLIQYLASTKVRKRLEVNIDDIFPANTTVDITAFYVDNNYKFDDRASISMTITNIEKNYQRQFPFSVVGNSYQLSIENLPPGDYTYTVSVQGQKINASGTFKITNFKVEEQFVSANKDKLERLAAKSGGKQYYEEQAFLLIDELLDDKRYYTTQKTIIKDKNILDWYWVLVISLILFAIEWFIRKYYGKI